MESRRKRGVVGLARLGARDLEFFRRLVAAIGIALGEQTIDGGLIVLAALALEIGTVRPAHARRLVEVEPEPVERALDLFDRASLFALRIGIFDSKHRRATMVTRKEPNVQRSTHTTNVKKAGGRGSKADANGHSGTVPPLPQAPVRSPPGRHLCWRSDCWRSHLVCRRTA